MLRDSLKYLEIDVIEAKILRSLEEIAHAVLPFESCVQVIRQSIPIFAVEVESWRLEKKGLIHFVCERHKGLQTHIRDTQKEAVRKLHWFRVLLGDRRIVFAVKPPILIACQKEKEKRGN